MSVKPVRDFDPIAADRGGDALECVCVCARVAEVIDREHDFAEEQRASAYAVGAWTERCV